MVSGGLDSTLAVKILLEAGIKVKAITFSSVFFGESYRSLGKKGEAPKPQVDELFGIELETIEMGGDYYRMVADPPHGFGSNANPCVDCHAFMLARTWDYAKDVGASFIATGEVLSLQAVGNVVSFPVEVRGERVLVSTEGRMAEPMWATGRQLGEAVEVLEG